MHTVTLIGMPGAGKSTVGHWLAAELDLPFIDTDALIVAGAGQSLQSIITTEGLEGLGRWEERVLTGIHQPAGVISTGGSAVYSEKGMEHLRTLGPVVYLHCDLATLLQRIGDHGERGILKRENQSFEDLFAEREVLYQRYADFTVSSHHKTVDALGKEIIALLGGP